MLPAYVECPTVFSCFVQDALSFLDTKTITFALCLWIVDFGLAYLRGKRDMERLRLAAKKNFFHTSLAICMLVVFILMAYSPYQRYDALKRYAETADKEIKEKSKNISKSCTSGKAGGLTFAGPSKGPIRKR